MYTYYTFNSTYLEEHSLTDRYVISTTHTYIRSYLERSLYPSTYVLTNVQREVPAIFLSLATHTHVLLLLFYRCPITKYVLVNFQLENFKTYFAQSVLQMMSCLFHLKFFVKNFFFSPEQVSLFLRYSLTIDSQ